MTQIEPDQLYSINEAALLVPSARGGHVSARTLHRWRKQKLLPMIARQRGARTYWFVLGRELRRLLGTDATQPPVGPAPESPTEREEAIQRALRTARAQGFQL